MCNIKAAIFFILFFTIWVNYGQVNTEKVFIDYNNVQLPETPNAASLGAYGDTPVNTATGIPSINIPIYTLQVDGVSVPISLSYHASGVKVNEIATAVGLKWTLNAGGGIFRSVSSIPDEYGWLTPQFGPLSDSFYDSFNPEDIADQVQMTGNTSSNGYSKTRDHNPDQYSYNFLGFSGKYITDFYEEAIKNQADELIIDKRTIEDQQGNTYEFGENDYTENSLSKYTYGSVRSGDNPPASNGYDYDNDIITGWMLTTINTKNNKAILFDYESYHIEGTMQPVSHTIASGTVCGFSIPSVQYAEMTTTNVTHDYTVQLLTKISSENVDILFEYSLPDSTLSTWKKKLMKIIINDKIKGEFKEFNFEYDKFSGDPRLKLKRVYEKKGNEELPGYSFDYITGNLPNKYSFSQDFFGYYNGKNNQSLAPRDATIKAQYFDNNYYPFGVFYDNRTGDRSYDLSPLKIGTLEVLTYPTGGSTKFYYQANAEYIPDILEDKYCGGLRISKIEDRDSDEEVRKTTTFYYEGLEGQSLETDKLYIQRKEYYGNSGGGIIKNTFHSSFAAEQDLIYNGYFYKKVTTVVTDGSEQHKKENNFIENFSFATRGSLLSSEKIFQNNRLEKIVEYQYSGFGIGVVMHWNILGHYLCIYDQLKSFRGYGMGRHIQYNGNRTMLPTTIATTDYLKKGSVDLAVTTVQEFDYDDETLLKTQEIFDSRKTRQEDSAGNVTYDETNSNGEKLTTEYEYPWSPGINQPDLPKALPISKRTYKNNENSDLLFGQYFIYDANGNIQTTFQFNKGEGFNTTGGYIPADYEQVSSFLFSNGKPVQVMDLYGSPTTYIWGLKGQFPVAKIEGKTRSTINQTKLNNVEQANYNNLSAALTALRGDATVQKAMVTTYTYKPLAGIETITDPKGDTITYHYDAFGRLDHVTDKEGNILTENEYKYGSQ